MELHFRYRTRSKVRRIVVVVACVFFGETFFTATFYVAKIIKVSPHHVAFSAISEVLNLKNFPGGSMPPDPPT